MGLYFDSPTCALLPGFHGLPCSVTTQRAVAVGHRLFYSSPNNLLYLFYPETMSLEAEPAANRVSLFSEKLSGSGLLNAAHFAWFRHARKRSSKGCDSRNRQRRILTLRTQRLRPRYLHTDHLNRPPLRRCSRGMRLYHRASSQPPLVPQATSLYPTQALSPPIPPATAIRAYSIRMVTTVSLVLFTATVHGGRRRLPPGTYWLGQAASK